MDPSKSPESSLRVLHASPCSLRDILHIAATLRCRDNRRVRPKTESRGHTDPKTHDEFDKGSLGTSYINANSRTSRVTQDANTSPEIAAVHAGATSVTAAGTAFNARRAGKRVVVAVAEGAVSVGTFTFASPADAPADLGSAVIRSARLSAGQQLSVDPAHALPVAVSVDTSSHGYLACL